MIFSYGVTNAGKSYTMIGDDKNHGILPNTLNWLLSFKKDLLEDNIEFDSIYNPLDINKENLFCLKKDLYTDMS